MKLYCFNPEHDLAVANGNENFQAPESALLLASDLAHLPAWYADDDSLVLAEQLFAPEVVPAGMNVASVAPYTEQVPSLCTVEPWGWDAAVRKYLVASGVSPISLPAVDVLDMYRCLSHRRTAAKAMQYIRERAADLSVLPTPAEELVTPYEVRAFAAAHPEIVLKSPWSGSGKGVFWSKGPLTQSLSGWCARVLEKQGCVMGEVAMERIQDFAMEYRVRSGKTTFAGYSLFITEGGGIYRGNRMMSNGMIEEHLSQWVAVDYLRWIQHTMLEFVDNYIAPHYDGYVGVDMFVYRHAGTVCVNPAVELNLRMTMGMATRIIYDRYAAPGSTGWFYIDHEPPGQLLQDHRSRLEREPMTLADGKLAHGYLSLCPILPNTVYRASIVLV